MNTHTKAILVLAILAGHQSSPTLASRGDRDPLFIDCIRTLSNSICNTNQRHPLPLALSLLQWTCLDNIKYECMHTRTTRRINQGQKILQYYGKWPFTRFMGLQEPASVAFSLMHLYVSWAGYNKIKRRVSKSFPLRTAYLVSTGAAMHAWIWSTIFHARDKPWTEKGDYFAAAFSIILNTTVCIARVFQLRGWRFASLLYISLLYFIFHILYLTAGPFDYRYNVVAMAVWGLGGCLTWLCWYARYRGRPYAWRVGVLSIGLPLGMTLELWDFPPIMGILDGHALWHLITIPIALLLYDFWVLDAAYDEEEMEAKES
ncbi:hypothetical protein SeMB42_g05804 [Synchytrium endobioticum]|uniref:Post-GPI attachment to proteins factor 3 n=1 Tax=Synchytrium endobioticum TaxID=286115 RepID=A0A507CPB6_9FUNG|nr:hypothetical protein SeMB42_g05804 [Synchytrium endobioticum]TPX46290.1 hypothetical protein SeLEV6574_g03303 [Synchytrium endobioticum]